MNREELVENGHAMFNFIQIKTKNRCYKFLKKREISKRKGKLSKRTASTGHLVPECN